MVTTTTTAKLTKLSCVSVSGRGARQNSNAEDNIA